MRYKQCKYYKLDFDEIDSSYTIIDTSKKLFILETRKFKNTYETFTIIVLSALFYKSIMSFNLIFNFESCKYIIVIICVGI